MPGVCIGHLQTLTFPFIPCNSINVSCTSLAWQSACGWDPAYMYLHWPFLCPVCGHPEQYTSWSCGQPMDIECTQCMVRQVICINHLTQLQLLYAHIFYSSAVTAWWTDHIFSSHGLLASKCTPFQFYCIVHLWVWKSFHHNYSLALIGV